MNFKTLCVGELLLSYTNACDLINVYRNFGDLSLKKYRFNHLKLLISESVEVRERVLPRLRKSMTTADVKQIITQNR